MTDEQAVYGWRELTPVKWQNWRGEGILSMFPELNQGDRVRARKKGEDEWHEGIVKLQWFGLEETIDVQHMGTRLTVSYYIGCGLGDEMEVRVER